MICNQHSFPDLPFKSHVNNQKHDTIQIQHLTLKLKRTKVCVNKRIAGCHLPRIKLIEQGLIVTSWSQN